jgi:hypothetical protein
VDGFGGEIAGEVVEKRAFEIGGVVWGGRGGGIRVRLVSKGVVCCGCLC